MRTKFAKFGFAFLSVLLFQVAFSQKTTYNVVSDNFPNPERGFYHYRMGKASNFTPLNYNDLVNMRTSESITLVWRGYLLDSFISSPISQDFLNKIQTDFNTMRQAGVKCILRFSYKDSGSTNPYEATKSQIISHIDQLKTVVNANQDVISSIEAGFIGKYGEWYYTTYFGIENLTPQNYADRLEVANKIMELAPSRMISFRTPEIIRKLYGNTPIQPQDAYNGSNKSRAASHNDCFLANATDYGTYINPAVEYPYLEQQTTYTLNGGEACGCSTTCSSDPYVAQNNAIYSMQRFHFNYLNIDYNQTVLNYWNSIGFLSTIKEYLGYRYVLNFTEILENRLFINFTNRGFGNVFNERKAYLVLRNNQTGQEYSYLLNVDLRTMPLGLPVSVDIPLYFNIPNGNYHLFLNLPDSNLLSPNYSIRCANENVWEPTTGYNDLQRNIQVNNLSVTVFVKDDMIQVQGVDPYKISVFDMSGKLVGESLDVSHLPRGVYMARLNDKTYKIVK